MHFGARYYLDQASYSENLIFQSRTVNPSYQLSGTARVYLGGDHYFDPCLCYLQYVRIYWEYVADSRDKMINLAMMNSGGINLFMMRVYT